MITFTTRQREILKIILDVKRPIGSGVKVWLKQNGKDLNVLPGVGFAIDMTADQVRTLSQKINIQDEVDHWLRSQKIDLIRKPILEFR